MNESSPRQYRSVGAGRAMAWWGEGWRGFVAAPLPWIGLAMALLVALFGLRHLPFGHLLYELLLAPLFAFGTVYASRLRRSRERTDLPLGVDPVDVDGGTVVETAQVWIGRLGPLLLASALVLLLTGVAAFALVLVASAAGLSLVGFAAMGSMMAGGGMMGLMGALSGGMLLTMLAAVLGALALNTVFWFVWPLVAIGGVAPWDAIVLSARAGLANLGALTVFNLLFFLFLILALVPLGFGLFVLLPTLAAASYAAYDDVFGAVTIDLP